MFVGSGAVVGTSDVDITVDERPSEVDAVLDWEPEVTILLVTEAVVLDKAAVEVESSAEDAKVTKITSPSHITAN